MNPQSSNLLQLNFTAIVFFVIFMAVTLGITYWAARRTRSTEDFFAAGRRISALQNGFALGGDFISAAGFLGVAGLVSLVGLDGMLFAVGPLIGFALMIFLIAEPVRNLGKYTFADVLAYRLNSSSIRAIAAISTLVLVINYSIMQMVGAGNLFGLMFHISYHSAVIVVGVLMTIYVLFGGMIATTWVQIIKCVLMLLAVILLAVLIFAAFGFNFTALFRAAAAQSGVGVLSPGKALPTPFEMISLGLSLGFGIAALPHVLMRVYTVPDARAARKSMFYALIIIAVFQTLIVIVGFGAMALVGPNIIRSVDRGGNMAGPLLAMKLSGAPFLGFVVAVSFATILASMSGLAIAGAAALSHDIWVNVIRRGKVNPKQQLVVAKIATVLLCILGIVLGILFKGQNIAWLVGLSNAVSSSANFPVLFLALFWRRLTTPGAVAGMVAGLGSSLLLLYLSPLVQVEILHKALPIVAIRNPGLITFPLAFVCAIVVSLLTAKEETARRFDDLERRILMGAEAERAEAVAAR